MELSKCERGLMIDLVVVVVGKEANAMLWLSLFPSFFHQIQSRKEPRIGKPERIRVKPKLVTSLREISGL